MRTLAGYEVGTWDLSVGTKFQFLSVHTSKLNLEDRFGEFMVGFDAVHPLKLTIAGNQAGIGGYYSKDEILALYLNETYFGGLAYGVEAASRLYLGKPKP